MLRIFKQLANGNQQLVKELISIFYFLVSVTGGHRAT